MKNNIVELSNIVNAKYFKAKGDLIALSDFLNNSGLIINDYVFTDDYQLTYGKCNGKYQIYLEDCDNNTRTLEEMNIDRIILVCMAIDELMESIEARLIFLNTKYDENQLSVDLRQNQ